MMEAYFIGGLITGLLVGMMLFRHLLKKVENAVKEINAELTTLLGRRK